MTLRPIIWTLHPFFPHYVGRIGNTIVARCGRVMMHDDQRPCYHAGPLPIIKRLGYVGSYGTTAQEAMERFGSEAVKAEVAR